MLLGCDNFVFVFIIFLVDLCSAEKQLLFVHALWRHGDRTPGSTFPTDTANNESTWHQGWGELTSIGINQQYALGEFLKKRYKNFLSENYDSKEIYVRSTDYNRTIMSALANLAGMYRPAGGELWNVNLTWQPIPIHVWPRESDLVVWTDKECPTADKLRADILKWPSYQTINKENEEFFRFLQNKSGLPSLITLASVGTIYDPLVCEYYHGAYERKEELHRWPSWVNETIFRRVTELYKLNLTFTFPTPEIQRLRGGLLFNEIADRMKEKAANKSSSRLKYYAYSGHDTTIVALLSNLGVFDASAAEYAELILVELFKQEGGEFIVEVYKRNGTTEKDIYQIKIPACGHPCTLSNFAAFAQTRRPSNWYTECGLPDPSSAASSERQMRVLVGLLIVVSILCFVLFVSVVVLYMKLRQNTGGRKFKLFSKCRRLTTSLFKRLFLVRRSHALVVNG